VRQAFCRADVIQRYYGFMLGFITNLLLFEFARPGYRIHKGRIDEVLADFGMEMRGLTPARTSTSFTALSRRTYDNATYERL
jgi:hypothetical protein